MSTQAEQPEAVVPTDNKVFTEATTVEETPSQVNQQTSTDGQLNTTLPATEHPDPIKAADVELKPSPEFVADEQKEQLQNKDTAPESDGAAPQVTEKKDEATSTEQTVSETAATTLQKLEEGKTTNQTASPSTQRKVNENQRTSDYSALPNEILEEKILQKRKSLTDSASALEFAPPLKVAKHTCA